MFGEEGGVVPSIESALEDVDDLLTGVLHLVSSIFSGVSTELQIFLTEMIDECPLRGTFIGSS